MNRTSVKVLLVPFLLLLPHTTVLATEFHVAPTGNDANRGTKSAPFRTIQRAAESTQPGDVITVHDGVYRERVNPPRGGISDEKLIIYQAAREAKVAIKGSERIQNWVKVQNAVWKVTLLNEFFGPFNPYKDLIHGDWFEPKGRPRRFYDLELLTGKVEIVTSY